jgi:hypothetical protein
MIGGRAYLSRKDLDGTQSSRQTGRQGAGT